MTSPASTPSCSIRRAPAPRRRAPRSPRRRCRASSPSPAIPQASRATPGYWSMAAIGWRACSRSTSSCGRRMSSWWRRSSAREGKAGAARYAVSLGRAALAVEHLLDGVLELARLERLGQDRIGAEGARDVEEHQIVRAAAAGHGDDLDLRRQLADLADGLYAFLLRHEDVRDDRVGLHLADKLHAFLAVGRLDQPVLPRGQRAHDEAPHRLVVVNYQNQCHAKSPLSRAPSRSPAAIADVQHLVQRAREVVLAVRLGEEPDACANVVADLGGGGGLRGDDDLHLGP